MNLLLITFSFPPAGGVGVLRALSLAKYLPASGIRVDVLTARNAPAVGRDESLLAQVPAEVTVHRTWTLDLPFALRKRFKSLIAGKASGAAKPAGRGNPLKRLIGNLLLPDPQVGWLPFALPAARRIVRKRGIDAVLITVPPFSSVRLVSGLRRAFPRLPIVLDFRDEWLSTTIDFVSFNNNARARRIAFEAEADAIRDATAIVAVTEPAQAELRARYPAQNPARFRYLANGFDAEPQPPSQPTLRDGKVLVTYIGSIYGSTDPGSFVEAILALPHELRARLRVRFIGRIETAAQRESLLRLGDTVELRPFVPQAEALRALAETDYVLLISHDRINVSAKFYDYLSAGKPIVAAIHPQGEVRRLLERTRAGDWADASDAAAIAALFHSILTGPPATFDPDQQQIARFHRRILAQEYANLLTEVIQA